MAAVENISIHRDKMTIKDLMELLSNSNKPNNTLIEVDIKDISQGVKNKEESLLDMIGAANGHRSFDTAEETDKFIRKLRDE